MEAFSLGGLNYMGIQKLVDQYVLLLPKLSDDGNAYFNGFYVIGNKWTERVSGGNFCTPNIALHLFRNDGGFVDHVQLVNLLDGLFCELAQGFRHSLENSLMVFKTLLFFCRRFVNKLKAGEHKRVLEDASAFN